MIYSINDFPFCINDYKGVLAMNSVPTLLHFTYQRFCILYQCLLGYLNNEFQPMIIHFVSMIIRVF